MTCRADHRAHRSAHRRARQARHDRADLPGADRHIDPRGRPAEGDDPGAWGGQDAMKPIRRRRPGPAGMPDPPGWTQAHRPRARDGDPHLSSRARRQPGGSVAHQRDRLCSHGGGRGLLPHELLDDETTLSASMWTSLGIRPPSPPTSACSRRQRIGRPGHCGGVGNVTASVTAANLITLGATIGMRSPRSGRGPSLMVRPPTSGVTPWC